MPVQTRFLFAMLWLIASENGNRIPYDMKWLSERIGMSVTSALLLPLLKYERITLSSVSGSVYPLSLTENSNPLADCTQDDSDTLAIQDSEFEQFWNLYPNKVGKKDALKAWRKAKDKPALVDMLQALDKAKKSDKWCKENGAYIPNPSTWLNQGRWADEPVKVSGNGQRPPPPPPKNDPIGRGQWGKTYGKPEDHGYV